MKIKNIISVLLCGALIFGMAAWCFFGPKANYSESERRALAKFPETSWENISSGKFATGFEKYATDAFPMRDFWRTVKAYTRLGLFAQKDNNDLFLKDGQIGKLEYPMKPDMMDYAANLFTKVWEKNFPDAQVYFAMIPDKNKDLADLKLDYAQFETLMQEKLPFATPIEISDLLSAEDYYDTDTHWQIPIFPNSIPDSSAHASSWIWCEGVSNSDSSTPAPNRDPLRPFFPTGTAAKALEQQIQR